VQAVEQIVNQQTDWQALPLALTPEEAGQVLRIGRSATYRALRSGSLPSIRVGRKFVIPRDVLRKKLEG
jgi:excisionase family DNA binding protein